MRARYGKPALCVDTGASPGRERLHALRRTAGVLPLSGRVSQVPAREAARAALGADLESRVPCERVVLPGGGDGERVQVPCNLVRPLLSRGVRAGLDWPAQAVRIREPDRVPARCPRIALLGGPVHALAFHLGVDCLRAYRRGGLVHRENRGARRMRHQPLRTR